jgi:predicted TIM-barrel fold metal-dependent hydrolase
VAAVKKLTLLLGLIGLVTVGAYASASKESTPAFEEIFKIDVHSHILEDMPEFVDMMDRINLHIVNICVRGTQPELLQPMEQMVELLHRKYPRQFSFVSTFDLTRRAQADYAEQVCQWLDKSFAAGALMTKVWKEVGMEIKTPTGAYIMPDDPIFDPIYRHLEKRGKPLIAHLAEPIAAWLPLDPESPHYGYYSSHPEWHVYQKKGFPSHARILGARDRLLEKYPKLTMVGAHCGSMSHDVAEIAKRMDKYPNFFIDVSARTKDLAFQPASKVRRFFLKYQDRILYGVDFSYGSRTGEPSSEEQHLSFTRRAEARYRQEYQYYAGSGTVRFNDRECECLALPRSVLEKFYHQNAQTLMPALAP